MSRHRIVRTMNYSDGMLIIVPCDVCACVIFPMTLKMHIFLSVLSTEYDEYDDVYGHSVDDESCISPTDAQQWMYDRNRGQQSIASFITNNHDIKEESDEETENVADELHTKLRRDSEVRIEEKTDEKIRLFLNFDTFPTELQNANS